MKIFITVTMVAESRQELIDHFPSQSREMMDMFRGAAARGGFALPPEKVALRFVLTGGRWENPQP